MSRKILRGLVMIECGKEMRKLLATHGPAIRSLGLRCGYTWYGVWVARSSYLNAAGEWIPTCHAAPLGITSDNRCGYHMTVESLTATIEKLGIQIVDPQLCCGEGI